MYHRIIHPKDVSYTLEPGMYVTPDTFEAHLKYYKTHCHVMSLEELIEHAHSESKIPKNTIAITFDDGWRDNYTFAFPLLKSHCLPATVFLATDFINSDRSFWTDDLIRLLAEKREPSLLHPLFEILTTAHEQSTVNAIDSFLREQSPEHASEVIKNAKYLPRKTKHAFIACLRELANTHIPPLSQFLTWNQLKEMSDSNLIQFGNHTKSHIPLSELTQLQVEEEVRSASAAIKNAHASYSNVFCYPEGWFTEETQSTLSRLGYKHALAASTAGEKSSPRLFPRVGLHEDVSKTEAELACRIWSDRLF